MTVTDFTRARDRLRRLEDGDPDLTTVLETVQNALHDVTSFSWSALMTVDPATLLPTGGIVEGFAAEACAPLLGQRAPAAGLQQVHRTRAKQGAGGDPLRGD